MKKVLVIDDETPFRETTVAALQAHGFATIEAENGRAGVRLAQEHLPDLILSDVQMGGFDGYAALAAIRYHPVTSTIPVILMTGAPDETGRRFAMEIGADDYLAKPFTIIALVAVIRIQLKKLEAIKKQALLSKPSDHDDAEVKSLADAIEPAGNKTAEGQKSPLENQRPIPSFQTPSIASLPTVGHGLDVTTESVSLVVEIYLQMLETCHPTLGNEARRSVALCHTLGADLELPEDELNALLWAASLGDIALVGASHQVVRHWLRHPHNLPKDEIILIHKHPARSGRMLNAWPIFDGAARIIRSHHERWDGTGFPDGLQGEQIPWLSRLLAAATFYCSRYEPHETVCSELDLQSNYLFDPKAVHLVMKAASQTRLPGGKREILVTELSAGLVLARDLRNLSGILLLPKGRLLTQTTVNRLMTINRVRPMDQSVLVYS